MKIPKLVFFKGQWKIQQVQISMRSQSMIQSQAHGIVMSTREVKHKHYRIGMNARWADCTPLVLLDSYVTLRFIFQTPPWTAPPCSLCLSRLIINFSTDVWEWRQSRQICDWVLAVHTLIWGWLAPDFGLNLQPLHRCCCSVSVQLQWGIVVLLLMWLDGACVPVDVKLWGEIGTREESCSYACTTLDRPIKY